MRQLFTIKPYILVFLLSLMSASLYAQQSKKISLQGFLKDANGKAVADGSQAMIFKVYAAATGGTAEWTEEQTLNVFGGVYSTHLGINANTGAGVSEFGNLDWGAKTYFVGVTVQGVELSPRTELTFAPYSLGSPKAQEVVCSGAVGDIKHSILNETQFAAVNGTCWVPMRGQSIAGSKLASITGNNTLPNGGGLFVRAQEFSNSVNYDPDRNSSSAIATLQNESFGNHNHTGATSQNGEHNHNFLDKTVGWFSDNFDGGSYNNNVITVNTTESNSTGLGGLHNHTLSVDYSGGSETRPDNINFWIYIRIN